MQHKVSNFEQVAKYRKSIKRISKNNNIDASPFVLTLPPANQPLMALAILLLIGGIDASRRINATSPRNSTLSPDAPNQCNAYLPIRDIIPVIKKPVNYKQEAIISACTRKLTTYNKPAFTLGGKSGKIVPSSCVRNDTKACEIDMKAFNKHNKQGLPAKTKQIRDEHSEKFEIWHESMQDAITDIIQKMDYQKEAEFLQLCALVANIKYKFMLATVASKYKGGSCAEHTSIATKSILYQKMQYKFSLKLQVVDLVLNDDMDIPVNDHTYLLIDSDVYDVNIEENPQAVRKYLSSIKSGQICDPWNHGYLAEVNNDMTKLYGKEMPWKSIAVVTFDIPISQLETLPLNAQHLICKELSELGIMLKPRAFCNSVIKKMNTPVQGSFDNTDPKIASSYTRN